MNSEPIICKLEPMDDQEEQNQQIDLSGFFGKTEWMETEQTAEPFQQFYLENEPKPVSRCQLAVRRHQFPSDIYFFQRNRHPSILEMNMIAREAGVTYENVFDRFEVLRCQVHEICARRDPCCRVRSFMKGNWKGKDKLTVEAQRFIHTEFRKMQARGEKLTMGLEHLIMEKTRLGVTTIRKEFKELYELMHKVEGRPLPVELKIVEIKEEERFPYLSSYNPPLNVIDFLPIDRGNYPDGVTIAWALNENYEVCYDHDYLRINEKDQTLTNFIRDHLLENRTFFAQNAHPSIREMIRISRFTDYTYPEVFSLFSEWRKILKIECSPNDPCERVRELFKFRTRKQRMTLGAVRILYREFERYGAWNSLDIGHLHLLMELTDLSAFVILGQHEIWKRGRREFLKTVKKF